MRMCMHEGSWESAGTNPLFRVARTIPWTIRIHMYFV